MQTNNNYILPNISKYTSFNELLESKSLYGGYGYLIDDKFSFKDLFSIKMAFIVAEPGYGKTRMLKEIVINVKQQNKQGLFIDLKKLDKGLDVFIKEKIDTADIIDETNSEQKLDRLTIFKTEDFSLRNSEKITVCLDALDEVKKGDFSKVVDYIKDFSRQYRNIHLFVSCRWHHFNKHQELFIDTDFNYVQIARFSRNQIKLFLERFGILKDNIERFIDVFKFKNRELLIQTPRYLLMIANIIKEKGVEYAKKLTKTEIFEYFIYKKLEIEEKKTDGQKKEIIKRILEKLALIMEIYQSNLLKKEELISFFDDVKSNLNISFLQQVPIEIFYERSLLKDNIDTIEFENTEFQEYLAAKELLRLGRTDQVIFDLAVDQELQEIFPSWFNTLSFAIDLDISLLKPILFFGAKKSKSLQDEEYHRLLTEVDTNRLSIEDREEIFKNVFLYYQTILHWISFDVARNLSNYFDISENCLLKESIDNRRNKGTASIIRKGNTAYIIAFILERDIFSLSDRNYWKHKLIGFVQDKYANEVLRGHAILALSKFKEIKLIKKISHLFDKHDEITDQDFLLACKEVDPNNQFSIQCFIEGIKRKNIIAPDGLWEVKQKKAVKVLLDYFVNDSKFLSQFVDPDRYPRDKENMIVQNIKDVCDPEIQEKLERIIKVAFSNKDCYLTEGSEFINNVALLLKERNKNYIFSLLKEIKKSKSLQDNLFNILHIFTILLEKEQVSKFVQELKKLKHGERISLCTLERIKFSKREDAEEIYEEGRKYFVKEYKEFAEYRKKQAKKTNEEINIYKDFLLKLEPSNGKYHPSVFGFYLNNKEALAPFIKKQDKVRLQNLIVQSIFEKFDPGEQKLTITLKEGNTTTYNTHSFIRIFSDCLKIAKELQIQISKYRKKIISYIPFGYYEDLKVIFELIPDPTNKEISCLLKVYKSDRKDDLAKFMPDSFSQASEQYMIVEAIPILKQFVNQTDFSINDRKSALKVIAIIQPDEHYFKEIFKKYIRNNNEAYQLAEVANGLLIEKFKNDDAAKWRFEQLRERSFPFVKPRGVHSVGTNESELHDKHFASPIMNLKEPKYKAQFLNLLDESFEIQKKGDEYWSYTTYLWQIAVTYFNNLKELKSYSHLKDLENYTLKHSSQEGMNWFKKHLQELKRKYIDYIGKPQNITECIKKYNKLKENQYLDVSTSSDLAEKVRKVINEDIRRWVEDEGAYKYIQEAKGKQEDLMQKTVKTQFENSLLKIGFRKNEVNIRREEQLLDDKRTDFLISFGFIGPILIEIKRVDNQEITNDVERSKYKDKLLQYMTGTNSNFAFFIILQINNKSSLKDYLPKVRDVYKDYDNVDVIGLDCVINVSECE